MNGVEIPVKEFFGIVVGNGSIHRGDFIGGFGVDIAYADKVDILQLAENPRMIPSHYPNANYSDFHSFSFEPKFPFYIYTRAAPQVRLCVLVSCI